MPNGSASAGWVSLGGTAGFAATGARVQRRDSHKALQAPNFMGCESEMQEEKPACEAVRTAGGKEEEEITATSHHAAQSSGEHRLSSYR